MEGPAGSPYAVRVSQIVFFDFFSLGLAYNNPVLIGDLVPGQNAQPHDTNPFSLSSTSTY